MNLGWVAIDAAGLAQSLFLAALLLGRRDRPSRWLAVILVAIACILLEEIVDLSGLGGRLPWIIGSTMAFELLLGPLLLFFCRALRRPARPPQRREWLHFLPFASVQSVLLGQLPLSALPGPAGTFQEWVLILKGPVFFAYLLASWRVLAGGREDRTLRWARRAIAAFAALGVATLLILHLGRLGVSLPFDSDRAAGFGLMVGIHAVALVSLWPRRRGEAEAAALRYATSPLSGEEKTRLNEKLLRHLDEDRPWLDGELTLAGLAQTSGIPRHHLSQVINEGLGTTFYELMARHRAEEARRLLLDRSQADRTVLDLAFAAGFNSKASFHRAFRKLTGTTPAALRRIVRQQGSPSTE